MEYVGYKCNKCKCEFVMLQEFIKQMGKERYVSCPYGHRDVMVEDRADTVRDCMKDRAYSKDHGTIKQTRYET